MIQWVLQKLLGTQNARELKRLWPTVERINRLEPDLQKLSDDQLRAKTEEFRARLRGRMGGTRLIAPNSAEWYDLSFEERLKLRQERRAVQDRFLNELLPEAFAVVREAARRTVNMRHFDVQLIGGMVLHEGKIAEMATGEGKTLVATLAVYLNALTGRGVHVVTVNDYLARRDARWMGPIYHALGLSVGVIQGVDPAERRGGAESLSFLYDPAFTATAERFLQLQPVSRREAYAADITYGQNNEFGFDYLRDNMRWRLDDRVQREYHFAVVDEVDSILIDEARTPLIISGPAEESTELYYRLDKIVDRLQKEADFEVDEKQRAVSLTEQGIARCEELLSVENLYDELNMRLVHHVNQALRAHQLFQRDVDYMVKDDEIIIVDEFTGRLMPGRRWSDGLHQAIEAKEQVKIREENQTLASVTFQNYFRMYEKLAGMTGTAATEAQEFREIYRLDVVTVPTNQSLLRFTNPDVVFKTEAEKFLAVAEEIVELHRQGRPVLVGTISIEKSERLSRMLKEPGPMLTRLATVCRWTAEELAKEAIPDALKQSLTQLVSRPAMLNDADAAKLLEQVKAAAPKSTLVWRLEDLVRLAQTAAAIKAGVPHNVLNAKYHEHEARIVAQAGRLGAVTIATNMAGRGTDILLGGNPQFLAEDAIREREAAPADGGAGGRLIADEEKRALSEQVRRQADEEHKNVVALGGLHMLGTERHEARRIDNQLRGRAGRQGDPGSSRFYLSLEDDLMRIFGSDRIAKLMEFKWFQWEEGLPIEHPWVTKSIETAQRRVEGENFEARKHLLEYDNIMNRQREVIYEQRRRIIEGVRLEAFIEEVIDEVADELVETAAPKELRPDAWDLDGLRTALGRQFGVDGAMELAGRDREGLAEQISERVKAAYHAKEQAIGPELMRQLERNVLLAVMDGKWKDHLYMMDALREGIGLRAYGQRDPLVEYQREAYAMFQDLVASVKAEALTLLLRIQPKAEAQPVSVFAKTPQQEVHEEVSTKLADRFPAEGSRLKAEGRSEEGSGFGLEPGASSLEPARSSPGMPYHRTGPKVGRNDPCPCGSGLKYKKCHGK
ncbi:MAG: SEC-C domain-containing protein [Candidatus Omnitrophica bacterium]|nr:SEC-C domain-containing protein [Candidatus Omnitrophota bacterium]